MEIKKKEANCVKLLLHTKIFFSAEKKMGEKFAKLDLQLSGEVSSDLC